MTISTKDWVNYINRLREINETAANIMREYVQKNGFGNTSELIQLAYAVADKYGNAAAELTCQMYEATAEAQGVYVQAAEPAETPTYAEVAKTVNGTIDSPETMCNAVGRLTKRTGADTMLKNAIRDGAEFAWVPHGDTCAFCIALASRGWQKASKKALKNGHAEHIHANCDCQYEVRFDGKSNVEGYEPDELLKMYNGDNPNAKPREKIKLLRRKIEEQNRQIDIDKNDVLRRDRTTIVTASKVVGSKHNVYVSENASHKQQNMDNIEKAVDKAIEKLNIERTEEMPRIIVVNQTEMGANALASYNAIRNEMYISDVLGNKKDAIRIQIEGGLADPRDYESTITHELIHWIDAEEYKKMSPISNIEEYRIYLKEQREKCRIILEELGINYENVMDISAYARRAYEMGKYEEVYTELRVMRNGK